VQAVTIYWSNLRRLIEGLCDSFAFRRGVHRNEAASNALMQLEQMYSEWMSPRGSERFPSSLLNMRNTAKE